MGSINTVWKILISSAVVVLLTFTIGTEAKAIKFNDHSIGTDIPDDANLEPRMATSVDVNGDGDIDIVAAKGDTFVWYENGGVPMNSTDRGSYFTSVCPIHMGKK